MEKTKIKAVGYIRVSTFRQADQGVSLDAQKEKINNWIAFKDAELIEIFSDNGISGTSNNRPGFHKAIETAIKHKAAFVCYSMSRFCRSIKETLNFVESLEKAGVDLVSLVENFDTTTANGKLIFRFTRQY